MKIMLLYPPQAQPFLPHGALPALKAFVESRSSHRVLIRDVNLESYYYFLCTLDGERRNEADGALRALCSGQEQYEPSLYYRSIEALQRSLSLLTDRYPGSVLDLKNFRMDYSTASSEQILQAARDHQKNPYMELFMTHTVPSVLAEDPGLVGLSVCWPSQIIPAFTLARMLKAARPDLHITLGGSMISHLSDKLAYKRKFFGLCSSFVTHEGEIPLLRLADAVDKGSPLSSVPGLIYPEGKKTIKVNPPESMERLDDLPVPDFEGYALDRYLSPLPYLPLAMSRGCYWNRCSFCSHAFSLSHFRSRHPEKIVADMKSLFHKTGARHFYFVDDAMPPRSLSAIAGLIGEEDLPFRWGGELRFDRYFLTRDMKHLYDGGCRFLLFGMESSRQEMLDRMRKGYRAEWVPPILQKSHDAGIINWLFLFLGFPGESADFAEETMSFIGAHGQNIDMIAPGKFILTGHSDVFRNPRAYGITRVEEPTMEYDMLTGFQFLQEKGLTADEAAAVLNHYRTRPEMLKFLRTFVTEVHLMFLGKSHFQGVFI